MRKKLSYGFIKDFIESFNYKLISSEYMKSDNKLILICSEGHECQISFTNFRIGKRCSTCKFMRLRNLYRKSFEEVKQAIELEGYLLISNDYVGANKKLLIKCPVEHTFSMSYNKFVNQGYRCSLCGGTARKEGKDVFHLFLTSKLIPLFKPEEYKNNSTKLCFVCPNHEEEGGQYIDLQHLQRGQGCRHCGIESRSKENSPLWRGGITPENLMVRYSVEYKIWRKQVFERDNFTCQCCGNKKSGNLQAHHIENFSENISLRLDINNGITLCKYCHDPKYKNSYHNIYGTKNNNREQLIKYLNEYRNVIWDVNECRKKQLIKTCYVNARIDCPI